MKNLQIVPFDSKSESEMEIDGIVKHQEWLRKIPVLNTSILTSFGSFSYKKVSLDEISVLVKEKGLRSYLGHPGTASLLTVLLAQKVDMNRSQYAQEVGEVAIVFKLKNRLEEGRVLNSIEEVEAAGYEFGLLERIS